MENQKMQLVDWLDDLCVRFIINLPQEELESVARICFQIEEAQWFYEDFIRPIDPTLPSMNLKQFSLKILAHCPLTSSFSDDQHLAAYQEFLGYKTRVPVRGAIMLNQEMDQVLLVKGWSKSASWSFPRGKINKDEDDLDCAVREVWEETGFDIKTAGLVPDRDSVKAIDITMRDQNMRLFVFRGVPMDTVFEPQTRKEISKIQWYKLNDLPTLKKNKQGHQSDGGEAYNPNRFYMVAPFLQPLKKWIIKQRKMDLLHEDVEVDEMPSEAYVEEQSTQLPEIGTSHPNMQDPAAELKRLLSVQAMQPQPQLFQQPQLAANQQRASQLLAMLNGGAPMPQQQQFSQQPPQLPQTPMEQILGHPQQPESPHVSHVQESPFARAQPPPQFPYQQSLGHMQAQMAQQGGAFQSQMGNLSEQSHLLRILQQSQGQANHNSHVMQQQIPQQQPPPPSQMPVAPPSSQLPPPRLNNHAMNLLSAFKNGPTAAKPAPNPNLLQTVRQNPPPRNAHQNSLLDLFKAPAASPTPPATSHDPVMENKPIESIHASTQAAPRPTAPPAAPRRASAMSMITRTLPRMKVEDRKPTAPVPDMDDNNFPTLGSTPVASKASLARASPAMQVKDEIKSAQPPVKILSRPASSKMEASTTARPASRPVSRGKPSGPAAQASVTILQRPTSASKPAPAPRQGPSPSTTAPKADFQPQILKRGDPAPPPPPATDLPSQSTEAPKIAPDSQRNTLLSLFAQSQPQRTQSPRAPSVASPTSPFTPAATNIPSAFMPPQVLSRTVSQNAPAGAIGSERARLGSSGSVAAMSRSGSLGGTMARQGSVGGESAGPKSPGTPVEARGFLMDYLQGVVKGGK
ncbi:hypothetical protein B9Z65_6928 [Elsinoe australis]|uniref:Nudix hydrolase domain-containing protein n=1 Tax=Elsinoe australis TaxID=40998 RepID=A0A2P7Z448_9PEZI|nr:hypothetical protein B9Z65_6928 [Elsinoe australis]